MANSKKYYWLKFKKDFFNQPEIQILESMPNGSDYIVFYLKLLCKSIETEGKLRLTEKIPYNETTLSNTTNMNIDTVRCAIVALQDLELIEIFEDGTIYLDDIKDMTGCETEWAGKKREYRKNKQLEDKSGTLSKTLSDKSKSKNKEQEIVEMPFFDPYAEG